MGQGGGVPIPGQARRPGWIARIGAVVAVLLGIAVAVPALAADEAPTPGVGSDELVWVYDDGVGKEGLWRWDRETRRWVLVDVREPHLPTQANTEPDTFPRDRPAYFVDCTAGADDADGGRTAPWRSLAPVSGRTLPAGAAVYLKRGCSWEGQLRIVGEQITVAPYGSGAPPVITAPTADREEGAVILDSPKGLISGVTVRDTPGAGITLAAPGAAAANLIVEDVAFGVRFTAPHTIADRVQARNLHLFTSTPKEQKADDDSGAVGFNVETTDVTVQNSSCFNCRAPSDDYGHDGGFIEIWREGDRLRAYNNIGYNVDGFLEIGGMKGSGDEVKDVLLQGNRVSQVYARALYINQGGPYDIPVTGLVMRDNVIHVVDGPAAAGDTSGVDIDPSNQIGRHVRPPVAAPSGALAPRS